MPFFMGIDGGGSHLRVVIVDDEMAITTQADASTANPAVIGRDSAAALIQKTISDALGSADVEPGEIAGVGIGIAGASAEYASDWLRETVSKVLPETVIAPSSDMEIALVGAHGTRQGVLLLAGTGSVAYGINAEGRSQQAGGWGYLLGDEGSGYWLGRRALQAATLAYDGRAETTQLCYAVLSELQLSSVRELIPWLYAQPRTRDVAQRIAPLVLNTASQGDRIACEIVHEGADRLVEMCRAVIDRLNMAEPQIALAGGLLSAQNVLSERVRDLLKPDVIVEAKYPPVVGAALLARIMLEEK